MAQEHKCPKCSQTFTSESRLKMHQFYKHETAAPKREDEHEPEPKPRAAARPPAKRASPEGRAAEPAADDDDWGFLND